MGEVRILRKLQHSNIISLFDVIVTGKHLVLVTEYLPGGELYNMIEKHGRLSEKQAHLFFAQIISGLEYCHDRCVTHRDIKPENILLDAHGNLKLADFGLSNLIKDG